MCIKIHHLMLREEEYSQVFIMYKYTFIVTSGCIKMILGFDLFELVYTNFLQRTCILIRVLVNHQTHIPMN